MLVTDRRCEVCSCLPAALGNGLWASFASQIANHLQSHVIAIHIKGNGVQHMESRTSCL